MIRVEFYKQVHRLRSWATLAVMTAVAVVVVLLIATSSPSMPERLGDWESVVPNSSGFALPLIALNTMVLFMLPLTASIAAGDSVASDASWGSLRYLLARPVRRGRVLGSKATVAAGICLVVVLAVTVVPTVIGGLAFGWGGLRVIDLQHTSAFHLAAASFSSWATVGRLLLASLFVAATLASVFSFSLLLSTLTTAPFSAVAGGIGLSLVSRSLDNIPGLHALSPWLPATDAGTTAWSGFFTAPMQLGPVGHTLAVQLAYTAVFLTLAWLRFTRSDVLS